MKAATSKKACYPHSYIGTGNFTERGVKILHGKIYAKDLTDGQQFFSASNGDPAPLFTADAVMERKIIKLKLEDFKGKWVILFFYPSNFTFV
ncbi:hypothetical protein CVD19_12365 [Bacillus sp. T33-2]|nr:hypothetical protein CVD19_12365 [Bacillus sp. T33-2]